MDTSERLLAVDSDVLFVPFFCHVFVTITEGHFHYFKSFHSEFSNSLFQVNHAASITFPAGDTWKAFELASHITSFLLSSIQRTSLFPRKINILDTLELTLLEFFPDLFLFGIITFAIVCEFNLKIYGLPLLICIMIIFTSLSYHMPIPIPLLYCAVLFIFCLLLFNPTMTFANVWP